MQITDSKYNNQNFKAIIVPNKTIRTKIVQGLKEKQIKELKAQLTKQLLNPVDAYISTKNNRLNAKLYCPYRLNDFKENYSQFPLFETNLGFLKRIIKKCDEYKKQLESFC